MKIQAHICSLLQDMLKHLKYRRVLIVLPELMNHCCKVVERKRHSSHVQRLKFQCSNNVLWTIFCVFNFCCSIQPWNIFNNKISEFTLHIHHCFMHMLQTISTSLVVILMYRWGGFKVESCMKYRSSSTTTTPAEQCETLTHNNAKKNFHYFL